MEAKLPDNEQERLAALKTLNVLDTPIEERFERVTRMLCRTLNVPVAAVTLVDEARQWFKSIQGATISETPRCISFCAHAILNDSLMVITDTTLDPRFSDNPLVIDGPKVRFYAGQPLSLSKNIRFGTLCALDTRPRTLAADEISTMCDLARIAESELANFALSEVQQHILQELSQAERAVRIDTLTRLWNQMGTEGLLKREWDFALRKGIPISVALVDIDRFRKINENYGQPVGDEVLRKISQLLLSTLRRYDAVGRMEDDKFMIVLPACGKEDVGNSLKRIRHELIRNPIQTEAGQMHITLSMGVVSVTPKQHHKVEEIIKKANDALLKAKDKGKGVIEIAVQ